MAKRAEIINNYENLLYNPTSAASRGFVDQVIVPRETPAETDRGPSGPGLQAGDPAAKKHGNIPCVVASSQFPEKLADTGNLELGTWN